MDVKSNIDQTSLVGFGISGSDPCTMPSKEGLFRALGADLMLIKPADSKEPFTHEPSVTLTYVGFETRIDPNIIDILL